jgi:lysozyme
MDINNKIDIINDPHMEQVKERIKKHEGKKNQVYKDTEGYLTVGIGYKLPKNSELKENDYVDDAFVNEKFKETFLTAAQGAKRLLNGATVKPEAFGVLTEMVFQMGEQGISKFSTMLKHLRAGDTTKAANEMLKGSKEGTPSKWSLQTPDRAMALYNIMVNLKGDNNGMME